jgi:hypothetical protein
MRHGEVVVGIKLLSPCVYGRQEKNTQKNNRQTQIISPYQPARITHDF